MARDPLDAEARDMAQIVLIGPIGTGKTTLGELLGARLGMRHVPMDLIRWGYYYRIGYDRAEERRRVEADGPDARFAYWKPFEADAVEKVIADFPDCVIDFGAGHSIQDDPDLFARVQAALATVPHVILILPHPDPERSLRILVERENPAPEHVEYFTALERGFVESPCNARLAKATVYTDGRTPEETCAEIVALVGHAT